MTYMTAYISNRSVRLCLWRTLARHSWASTDLHNSAATSHIPHLERHVTIGHFLNVAADGRLGLNHFAEVATWASAYR